MYTCGLHLAKRQTGKPNSESLQKGVLAIVQWGGGGGGGGGHDAGINSHQSHLCFSDVSIFIDRNL